MMFSTKSTIFFLWPLLCSHINAWIISTNWKVHEGKAEISSYFVSHGTVVDPATGATDYGKDMNACRFFEIVMKKETQDELAIVGNMNAGYMDAPFDLIAIAFKLEEPEQFTETAGDSDKFPLAGLLVYGPLAGDEDKRNGCKQDLVPVAFVDTRKISSKYVAIWQSSGDNMIPGEPAYYKSVYNRPEDKLYKYITFPKKSEEGKIKMKKLFFNKNTKDWEVNKQEEDADIMIATLADMREETTLEKEEPKLDGDSEEGPSENKGKVDKKEKEAEDKEEKDEGEENKGEEAKGTGGEKQEEPTED